MSNTSDAILIQRVLTGDTEAFAPLLQRYEASVYGLMLRLTGSETEAEELTQEAFVSAYIHLADYRAEAEFGSWLYRVAYNAALMHLRQRKIAMVPIDERLADSVSNEDADAALSETTEERVAMLQQALTLLTPDDRTLITLFYLKECTTKEIAYVLGCTVTSVTTKLYRARKRLSLIMRQL